MKRRQFITLLGGAAATCPLAARAQQGDRVRRIGVLAADLAENDPTGIANVSAFTRAFQQLGWIDGRNVRIDVRWAASDIELMRRFAKELVDLQPDVIVSASTPGTAAVKRETRTIPVIFVVVSDPIGEGFTANHLSALAGTSVRSSSGSNPRPREERHHSRGATFPL